MKRYIALLRGINISGKNKISMSELKQCFIEHGFTDVVTHLNSGNVVFSIQEKDENMIAHEIEEMVKEHFGFAIPVYVISQERLRDLLKAAPEWWGQDNAEIYDNLIFVMPPYDAENISAKIGEPTHELEQVFICDNVIFWSFDRKKYAKANWWKKTASAGIGEVITIRTANTVKKIARM